MLFIRRWTKSKPEVTEVKMDRHYSKQKIRSLRKFVEFIDRGYSNVSISVIVIHLLMETISVAFYVWTSQVSRAQKLSDFEWNVPVFIVEAALNIIFFLEWIAFFFFETDKKRYFLSWLSLVNLLTSVPMIILGIGAIAHYKWRHGWVPMFLRVWGIRDCVNLLLDYDQIGWFMNNVYRELGRFAALLFAVMCTCIGIHQIVESCVGNYMDIYTSFYMMIVAFATIGFGDVTPQTTAARLFMTVFCFLGVCLFLPLLARLGAIADTQQYYCTFRSVKGGSHVIICGSLNNTAVDVLLQNFYSGWRKYLDTRIVLLTPDDHSGEMRLTANLPWLRGRVKLMVGDPCKELDLHRIDARHADAIFLLGNTNSSGYYNDYVTIAQSLAVSLHDPDLPQHLLIRRGRSSKQVAQSAASALEMERTVHNLIGLSIALPGIVPLIVNLLRTYEPRPSDSELSRHWIEQYEYSIRNDLYGIFVPDPLRGRSFRQLVLEFLERGVTLIGVLDGRSRVQLNPLELPANAKKIILIAKTLRAVEDAAQEISERYELTFGEEMLTAPDPDIYKVKQQKRGHRVLESFAEMQKENTHLAQTMRRKTLKAQQERPPSSPVAAASDARKKMRSGALAVSMSKTDLTDNRSEESAFSAPDVLDGTTRDLTAASPSPPGSPRGLQRGSFTADMIRVEERAIHENLEEGDEDDEDEDPEAVDHLAENSEYALVEIDNAFDFENHFVVIDLSPAKGKVNETRYSHEGSLVAMAHDVLQVLTPLRQSHPENDIVLLTNDVSFAPYFERLWLLQQRGHPVRYISGCGLNTADLRRCNLEQCAGCAIVFSGDISRDGSTSAMAMLTTLTIRDIMGGVMPFPIVVELEGLANLTLFSHYNEDALRIKAESDFVFEPYFLIGNAVSRLMLLPALQRTYFMEEFIDVMDTLISGRGPDMPAVSWMPLAMCETELETYHDVVSYCLKIGFLPIALHRRINDSKNYAVNGYRFVMTNPPRGLPVHQQSDAIFYLTPG